MTKIIRKTTSIKIDPDVWKEARKYCIDNNMDVSVYIEKLIKKERQPLTANNSVLEATANFYQ